jgi:integrating conjugative element protein (TIGR03757 family)
MRWPGLIVVCLLAFPAEAGERLVIQVFTSASVPPSGLSAVRAEAEVQVYEVDAVAQIEHVLSAGLAKDPQKAKTTALERLQALDESTLERLEHGAFGLALARQHGLDRYPAVVINGETILYGITDLVQALAFYREHGEQ